MAYTKKDQQLRHISRMKKKTSEVTKTNERREILNRYRELNNNSKRVWYEGDRAMMRPHLVILVELNLGSISPTNWCKAQTHQCTEFCAISFTNNTFSIHTTRSYTQHTVPYANKFSVNLQAQTDAYKTMVKFTHGSILHLRHMPKQAA